MPIITRYIPADVGINAHTLHQFYIVVECLLVARAKQEQTIEYIVELLLQLPDNFYFKFLTFIITLNSNMTTRRK